MNSSISNSNTPSNEQRVKTTDYRVYLVGLFGSFIVAYLLTMLFIHNSKMMILDREYSMWRHVKELANSKSGDGQELIVIGDSRAKAGYIPTLTEKKTINLSLAGQTPVEGYYLLVNYLNNNPVPDKLVLSYAPFHLSMVDVFWDMTVKYGFLSPQEYNEVLDTSYRLGDKILGEKDKRWQYLFLPNMYWDSVRRAIKEKRWHTNEATYHDVVNSRGHYFYGKKSGATDLNQDTKLGKFVQSRMLDFYLVKLIDLAQSRKIEVFWYTMPFSEKSCQKLPASFKRDFEDYVSYLESTRGIKVIEKIACFPNDLFGDSNHLYLGAKAATRAILDGVFQIAPTVAS